MCTLLAFSIATKLNVEDIMGLVQFRGENFPKLLYPVFSSAHGM
jgi:hypothetical protein